MNLIVHECVTKVNMITHQSVSVLMKPDLAKAVKQPYYLNNFSATTYFQPYYLITK